MSDSPRMLWDTFDVACWLQVPTRSVEAMARAGAIPSRRLPDGSLIFDPDELAAWLGVLPSASDREVTGVAVGQT